MRAMTHEDGLPLPARYWAILAIALGITLAVIDSFFAETGVKSNPEARELVAEIMLSGLKLVSDGADLGQLKLVRTALKEMRHAYRIFNPYRGTRKISIFGSARTPPSDPDYAMARDFSRAISHAGMMIITGAGDGIMKAGHEGPDVDIAGDKSAQVRVERQDLDEMVGNLVENAAKYGGGRVFVTVEPKDDVVDIIVEDDGRGIPQQEREAIFQRGARLDTDKPGTGLGLSIVRDVAEIYGGRVSLEESEDLGGLLARLSLPAG